MRAVGLAADPATGGYWILKSNGGVDNFHAPYRGSLYGKIPAGATVTAIAAGRPGGYLVLTSTGGPVPASLRGRQWDVIPTSRKTVALTFDIGPTNGVKKTLATLRRDNPENLEAHATQLTAGVICGILALAIAIVFSVRVGTFVTRNTNVFTSFDNCIAKASNRSEVSNCIAHFANGIR